MHSSMIMVNAEVIAVGSEMLLGGRREGNSLFITDALASIGIEVRFKSIVGDVQQDIIEAIRTAAKRVDLVIMTGGLGPTVDDCTRGAVAKATGRSLSRRAEALHQVRERLAHWGRSVQSHHRRQALFPAGSEILSNPIGSAPGFMLRWNGRLIVVLPGVPEEAQSIVQRVLLPKLLRLLDLPAHRARPQLVRRVFHTFGVVETEVQSHVKDLVGLKDIRIGILPSPRGVSLSLLWEGNPHPTPRGCRVSSLGEFEKIVRTVRDRLGAMVFGEDADTMEAVVGRQLAAQGLTLALAESCTGGLIGHRLTQVPGSSAYFDRGVVCYSNEAKHQLLGVPNSLLSRHGAVSAQVAAAMAIGIRRRSGVALGLSVTGIAGPDGGSVRKPVGLVYVGLDSGVHPKGRWTRTYAFRGDRSVITLRASQAALNLLRVYLARRT